MTTLYISRLARLAEEAAQKNEAAFETVSERLARNARGAKIAPAKL
jgi:hypothetical protein